MLYKLLHNIFVIMQLAPLTEAYHLIGQFKISKLTLSLKDIFMHTEIIFYHLEMDLKRERAMLEL